MQTQKVQITLTPQEATALMFKARTLGYNMAKYIKFLISHEAYSIIENVPTYQMSVPLEKKTIKALSDYQKGKLTKIENLEELDKV